MALSINHKHLQVLAAVVEEYIKTAKPVGSQTVARAGFKASSATVRNLMGDLEQLGLLEKPHTSAGRVPTNRGIRSYVDHLAGGLRPDQADRERIQDLVVKLSSGELLSETALALSRLSHQVGVIMFLPAEKLALKSVHLVPAGAKRVRVYFNFLGGIVEERVIANEWDLDASFLQRLQNLVNRLAPGRTLFALRLELLRNLDQARGEANRLLARAVEFSARLLEADQPELLVHGRHHLLEGADGESIAGIRDALRSLEEKAMIVDILAEAQLARGVRTFIGEEISSAALQCCSLVVTSYGRGEMPAGTLGVIGPTRMDYARIIPLVDLTSELLSRKLEYLGRPEARRSPEI